MGKLRKWLLLCVSLLFVSSAWAASGFLYFNGTDTCGVGGAATMGGFNYLTNVQVNPAGTGDLLIFPFFYSDPSVTTRIKVINTDSRWGIVAKVVIRSARCSQELRDFYIYLSPGDVWTAELKAENGAIHIVSTDESVIVPETAQPASEENPFDVPLEEPTDGSGQFGDSVYLMGYLEVMAVAKVNFGWKNSMGKSFYDMAGSDVHGYMRKLFAPTSTSYGNDAYCVGNDTMLTGLILPFAYDNEMRLDAPYYPDCNNATTLNATRLDPPLYGLAEFRAGCGYATYRAVAVENYVLLGSEVTLTLNSGGSITVCYDVPGFNESLCDVSYNYKGLSGTTYTTYLQDVGLIDALDKALMKSNVYAPYYRPFDTDADATYVMLANPTMQSEKYDKDKNTCLVGDYTSALWKALWAEVTNKKAGIHVWTRDNHETLRKCELSPCVLSLEEVNIVQPQTIFDPYMFTEGWMDLRMPSGKEIDLCSDDTATINGLPTIPLVLTVSGSGIDFTVPAYCEGSIEVP